MGSDTHRFILIAFPVGEELEEETRAREVKLLAHQSLSEMVEIQVDLSDPKAFLSFPYCEVCKGHFLLLTWLKAELLTVLLQIWESHPDSLVTWAGPG